MAKEEYLRGSCLLNIGSVIRKRRRILNLSQKELANQAGLNMQTIFQWEKGIRFPSIPKAAKVLELLEKLEKEQFKTKKDS